MGKKKPPKPRDKPPGIFCVPLPGPNGRMTGSVATLNEEGYKQWLARQRAEGHIPPEPNNPTEIQELLQKILDSAGAEVDHKPPNEESD